MQFFCELELTSSVCFYQVVASLFPSFSILFSKMTEKAPPPYLNKNACYDMNM